MVALAAVRRIGARLPAPRPAGRLAALPATRTMCTSRVARAGGAVAPQRPRGPPFKSAADEFKKNKFNLFGGCLFFGFLIGGPLSFFSG